VRIIVIGAGAVGAACSLSLAEAGADVVVIDRGGIAAETSSRCEGNILVSDKAPGPEADLAIVANRAWRTLAERLDAERLPGQPSTESRPRAASSSPSAAATRRSRTSRWRSAASASVR
jgi:D-hydroxyproline dehydrogenase subunit beta